MKKTILAGLFAVAALGLFALPGSAGLLRNRRCGCDCCPSYLACCQPPGVFAPNPYVGSCCSSCCCRPRLRDRLRMRRNRRCCDLCGGCPSCLSMPSVFTPAPTPAPPAGPATGPTAAVPGGPQQASYNTIQRVGHEEPTQQFGGFVNPYGADVYSPDAGFAHR